MDDLHHDPEPLILKRMTWDIFPHDPDLIRAAQAQLGLVPDTPDGLDVEHDASDTRLNNLNPLSDVLRTLSASAARVAGRYLITSACQQAGTGIDLPDGFHESFAAQNEELIYDASYAIIAHLMDTGVLAWGEEAR